MQRRTLSQHMLGFTAMRVSNVQSNSGPRAPLPRHIEGFSTKPSEENFAARKCNTIAS